MKKHLIRVAKHPLISGSTIIVIGTTIANFFNYIFNFEMGRLLTVSEFGIFTALVSLLNIFFVFSNTTSTVFAKFSASYIGQKKEENVSILYKRGNFFIGIISVVISVLIVFFATFLAAFLHIRNVLLIDILSLVLFFSYMSAIGYGVLQGALRFFSYSIVYITSSFIKVLLGLLLVLAGFHIYGAMWAMCISIVISCFFLYVSLKRYIHHEKANNLKIPNLGKSISNYAVPVFFSNIGMTMMISIDVVLVKHFFPETQAGQYGALALMGRIIFFVVSPITFVFFPLIAQKKEKNEDLRTTILLSAGLIGIPTLLLSLGYFLFPHLILQVVFPNKGYSDLANLLGPFSIFIVLYTFCFFLNSYYLSIGKTKIFVLSLLAVILEVLAISFSHKSLLAVITNLSIVAFLLLISLLLYYFKKKA